jgi:hypothetical protein
MCVKYFKVGKRNASDCTRPAVDIPTMIRYEVEKLSTKNAKPTQYVAA